MSQRVRIIDIAEELGVSTATVSNVIHGKTKKISDETVKRVQQLLEEKQYIPSMAGILLAQNDSKIIGVIINNHKKYEGKVLEDGYVASAVNYLSREVEAAGYFLMLKVANRCEEIIKYASMWNMEGLVLMGFCEEDYSDLRNKMHIPFVVYDGYFVKSEKISNILIDNYDGGYKIGEYLKKMGHNKILCISDNDVCMDLERYKGLCDAVSKRVDLMIIPIEKDKRLAFYKDKLTKIKEYTAIFAVSDYYAVDIMQFLQGEGINVPKDISVVGFDDSVLGTVTRPTLTTIKQDREKRAEIAIRMLQDMKQDKTKGDRVCLPVELVIRDSVKNMNENE